MQKCVWGEQWGKFTDISQCNAYLSRACSIHINSWWPPFLLHKDGFPPFSASGWLDMTTFHVVIFPNWRLNDFFPLPIIISWRNESKTLTENFKPPKEGNFSLLFATDSVLHSRCTFMRNFKMPWFGKKSSVYIRCHCGLAQSVTAFMYALLLVMSSEFNPTLCT